MFHLSFLRTILQRFLERRTTRASLQSDDVISVRNIALIEARRVIGICEVTLAGTLVDTAVGGRAKRRPVGALHYIRRCHTIGDHTNGKVLPGGSVVDESTGGSTVDSHTLIGLIRTAPLCGKVEVISRGTLVHVGRLLQGATNVVHPTV